MLVKPEISHVKWLISNWKEQASSWSPVSAVNSIKAAWMIFAFSFYFPDQAAAAGQRLEKAHAIIRTAGSMKMSKEQPGVILVQSSHNPRGWYEVDLLKHTCTCPDFPTAANGLCKHRLAAGVRVASYDWYLNFTQDKACFEAWQKFQEAQMQEAENV